MWREMIMGWNTECTFFDPATSSMVDELEKTFAVQLPQSFRELLLETNGLHGSYELGVVYHIDGIKSFNLEMRQDEFNRKNYMPFDHLLFFGDDGAGARFGFPIPPANIVINRVFLWEPIGDDRYLKDLSLEDYLKRVLHYGSDK